MHRSTSGGGFDGFRCANRQCPAQASVNRVRAEEFVIERTLAERGESRMHELTVVGPDDADLALIEQALRETGAALATTDDDAESARLMARIASLKARRTEARSVTAPVKRLVAPTRGQETWGEEFSAALDAGDVAEASRLLREQVEYVTVQPTGQNARAKVAARASIKWVPLAEEAA
jgi:hypothetical protein